MTLLEFRREPGMNGSTLKVATPMLLAEVVHCGWWCALVVCPVCAASCHPLPSCVASLIAEMGVSLELTLKRTDAMGGSIQLAEGSMGLSYKGRISGWEQDHADKLQLKTQSCPSGHAA